MIDPGEPSKPLMDNNNLDGEPEPKSKSLEYNSISLTQR